MTGSAGTEEEARRPVCLVSTYLGDHSFFASAGLRSWLPRELPLTEARLEDIMEM